MAAFDTHVVENQPPPLSEYNAWTSDLALCSVLAASEAAWGEQRLTAYGALAGGELRELGEQANRQRPVLHSHDRFGHRIDEVAYHPAYHQLMAVAMAHGLHALPWQEQRPGAHTVRAALEYLHHQAEAGSNCPLTMTYASVPTLRQAPALAAQWLPKLAGDRYDPAQRPMQDKSAVTIGMGMTEKQGGSDVRANSTVAEPDGHGAHVLTGHKWFLSAPMSDAFLVLAQAPSGLGCFLMPRLLPDGTRNAMRLQRLKDKLGNHANASAEVEFAGTVAWLVGEEGRGIATILEMVALTRLDCMVGSAALMRQALVQALHQARHRRAFGRPLVEQPLMTNVLADLALESEAAMVLAMRTALALDRAGTDRREAALARLLTPVGKYWICRRAPAVVNEAQECLGGAGYVEESILPRLYREAPLNSIWEGSGNIQCLDVLRVLAREPAAVQALLDELGECRGTDAGFDRALAALTRQLQGQATDAVGSRRLTEQLALLLQASLLWRWSPPAVAAAFCRSRLGGEHGLALGTLPGDIDLGWLCQRSFDLA